MASESSWLCPCIGVVSWFDERRVLTMSVELRPLGVQCNIQCQYCYQNPQRDAGGSQAILRP